MSRNIDFGDYVEIDMKRDIENEMFRHKVIKGGLESNCYVDVPIKTGEGPKVHMGMQKVLEVVCCGVDETKVFKVREDQVRLVPRKDKIKEYESSKKIYEELHKTLAAILSVIGPIKITASDLLEAEKTELVFDECMERDAYMISARKVK